MLILVAVTVNLANENGGLFVKTREAKQDTAYKAEEENLATYMYGEGVYDAIKGEVNLDNLKASLDNSGEWGTVAITGTKLTVIGKQSGEEHIVNIDGTIGDKKDDIFGSIAGTYYFIVGEDLGSYAQFNEDGSIKVVYVGSDGTIDEENETTYSYTYKSETKKGIMSVTYEGETETIEFDYITIKDESGNKINSGIVFDGDSLEFNWIMKNGSNGMIPLTGNKYINGSKTIEFTTSVMNGETYGWCVIKENGTIMDSGENNYICLNRKIITNNNQLRDDEITVNSDYSELTVIENGISTVYTKQ